MTVAGAQQHDVAPPHGRTLARQRGVEVVGQHRIAGHQVVDTAQRGDVEQHAARDDAVAQRGHRVMGGAVDGGDETGRLAVVHHAVEEHVRQRVDVRDVDAVTTDADVFTGRGHAIGFAVAVRMEVRVVQPLARLDHEALLLARRILRLDLEGARHGDALANESGCRDLVRVVDVIGARSVPVTRLTP